jgi:hypothetical protein
MNFAIARQVALAVMTLPRQPFSRLAGAENQAPRMAEIFPGVSLILSMVSRPPAKSWPCPIVSGEPVCFHSNQGWRMNLRKQSNLKNN